MHFLKIGEAVIAFSNMSLFDVARCAVACPGNVWPLAGRRGYTVQHPQTGVRTTVLHTGVREYKTGLLADRDAASLYRVCRLIKDVKHL